MIMLVIWLWGLNALPGFSVNTEWVQTNIVFAKLDSTVDIQSIAQQLRQAGIIITAGNPVRFVTHKDITRQDIDTLLAKLRTLLA